MDTNSFLLGAVTSYLIGLIVSIINMVTEKALMIRRIRKENENTASKLND